MKLPQEFSERMKLLLGKEYEEFLETYEEPRRYGLRVNTLKISAEEFERIAPFPVERLPWIPGGYWYERPGMEESDRKKADVEETGKRPAEERETERRRASGKAAELLREPSRHPFYYAGLYYLQEPSAMTPASVLPVEPGDRVLDLCAAPGGKATALAAKLKGKGLLVANDISASRAKALLKNLEVFGVPNAFVTNAAPPKLESQFPLFFDKILVDAPCSGEGMFRKDAANARAWSLEKVEECARIQKGILRSAAAMLRPGGMLLYSTCTFAPEEDEQAAAYLLREFPEMELCDIPWYEGFSHGRPELGRETWQNDPPEIGIAGQEEPEGETWQSDPPEIGTTDQPEPGRKSRQKKQSAAGGADSADLQQCGRDDRILAQLDKCVRIFPHKMCGEGHFLALFRKREQSREDLTGSTRQKKRDASFGFESEYLARNGFGNGSGSRGEKSSRRQTGKGPRGSGSLAKRGAFGTDQEILREFLRDVRADFPEERIEVRNGQVYLVPETLPEVQGIPFLRNGLYMGEIRKARFEPSQSLAMALRSDEYASVINFSADDERVYRYLRGETIEADDLMPARAGGWQLVCADGYPLGWGKLANGTLKNKYHSGWRM